MIHPILFVISTLTGGQVDVVVEPAPDHRSVEVFFGLRTYPPVMYDGIDRFSCEDTLCRQLSGLDTSFSVGRISDERYVSLRRRPDPTQTVTVGTLQQVTNGRLTQWRTSPAATNIPQIRDYEFANAQQTSVTDVYVGLWHTTQRGRPKTIVVLFDGGNVAGAGRPERCGPYSILASVDERVDLLESRYRLHRGEMINLASYDESAKAVWLARMLLPEAGLPCDARR